MSADEETQQRLIQDLASKPEETLDALIASIERHDKPLLGLIWWRKLFERMQWNKN